MPRLFFRLVLRPAYCHQDPLENPNCFSTSFFLEKSEKSDFPPQIRPKSPLNTYATLVAPAFSGVNLVEMVKRKNSATNYYEYWPARDAYFATWPDHAPFHSVNRLIELLGRENVKGVGNLSQPLPDESDEYLAHRRTQEMMRNALIRLIGTLELDALIYPFSLKGPRKWINRSLKGMEETALAAHTRLPAIVVPAGYISGDGPIALGFIGKPFSDLTLLQAAHLYESHYPIRREPNLTWWRDAEETLGR